jgi:hypothetical protein
VCAAAPNRALARALDAVDPQSVQVVKGLQILLVPGILYRDYPHTGADGAVLREIAARLAIPFHTVPLNGTEGLQASAEIIAERLLALPSDARVLLFSLSKGSAEVRYALASKPGHPAFRCIRAWVSVSGLPLGTPSVELVLRRPVSRLIFNTWFWLKGWNLRIVRELLMHRPDAPFELPEHIRFVQVAAFPIHADLRDRRSKRLRRRLAAFGPNDGFAVLGELAKLPGYLYALPQADHYLRGVSDLPTRITRLIGLLGGSDEALSEWLCEPASSVARFHLYPAPKVER